MITAIAVAFVGFLAHLPPTGKAVVESLNDVPGVKAELREEGFALFIPGLVFDLGSSKISNENEVQIRQVVELLNTNGIDDDVVYFEGHSSSIGGENYNLRLSEARAKSVMKAYEEQGLSPIRTFYEGYGETIPRFQPPADRRNQRVEVIVVDLK